MSNSNGRNRTADVVFVRHKLFHWATSLGVRRNRTPGLMVAKHVFYHWNITPGAPSGNRTRVIPLEMEYYTTKSKVLYRLGFEPKLRGSESRVLTNYTNDIIPQPGIEPGFLARQTSVLPLHTLRRFRYRESNPGQPTEKRSSLPLDYNGVLLGVAWVTTFSLRNDKTSIFQIFILGFKINSGLVSCKWFETRKLILKKN